jgi:GxxExxY protein
MTVPILSLDAERSLTVASEPAMRGAEGRLVHEEITGRLLSAFFAVHRELGYGFVDAVYARALLFELAFRGLEVQPDVPMSVFYKGRKVGSYAADLLIEGKVVVTVRAAGALGDADRAQLLNYMRCSSAEVGMLLNFGPRPEFRRFLGRTLTEAHARDGERSTTGHDA